MQHWGPIIQTLLWIALIVGVLWYFRSFVEQILRALESRIKSGDPVEAWGVKLGARPLTSAEQAEKIERDVEELTVDTSKQADVAPDQSKAYRQLTDQIERSFSVAGEYVLLEDLALRATQDFYGVPITRQMRLGSLIVDGLFTKDGKDWVVEVKVVRGTVHVARMMNQSGMLLKKHAVNARLVFVIVLLSDPPPLHQSPSEPDEATLLLRELAGPEHDVHVHYADDLRQRFSGRST